MPKIQIVDENDNVIGAEEKKIVHDRQLIHRIVRVFLFNPTGELYLQKRGAAVKDMPGSWEVIAGHVDEGEDYETAAHRETSEEAGVAGLKLKQIKKYYTDESKTGFRRRFNMLYSTVTDQQPMAHPREVAEGRWLALPDLKTWIQDRPEDFTAGFLKAFEVYNEHIG